MLHFANWLESTPDPWLAGSTLLNPDGTPMMLFHGTSARPFKQFEFRKGKRFVLFSEFEADARGFFFTEHPAYAREYGPNVVACHVRMTRPFVDPRVDKHLGVDRLPRDKEVQLAKLVAPMIERDPGGNPFIDIGVRRHYLTPQRDYHTLQWAYYGLDRGGLVWDVLDSPGSVERLARMGYDGSWVSEPHDATGRSVFVLKPDQVRMIGWNNFDQWKRDHPLDDEDEEEKYDWRVRDEYEDDDY